MGYSCARVSAAATLRVEDYIQQGRRSWLRLHEKGGKRHEVPCHYALDQDLDAWIRAAGIGEDKKGPLFRSIRKGNKLTSNAMTRSDVLYMIKRRARDAALPYPPAATRSARLGSPLIYKTAERSNTRTTAILQGLRDTKCRGWGGRTYRREDKPERVRVHVRAWNSFALDGRDMTIHAAASRRSVFVMRMLTRSRVPGRFVEFYTLRPVCCGCPSGKNSKISGVFRRFPGTGHIRKDDAQKHHAPCPFVRFHRTHKTIGKSAVCGVGLLPVAYTFTSICLVP